MARWALPLIVGTLLFANTAWLEEASDVEGSADDVDYADVDDENVVSNGSSIEPMYWDGRRATPKIPPRQRIWKAIRREVRDMKNILPTLANNISFMELDVRDMSRNFFAIAGDVRFIKNEVMYIKRQGHIIWENVTDTRRDHKRMNKTLWWILGNVTQVIEDVDRTSMAITSIGTSYGSLAVELDKAVSHISEGQTMSNDFENMRSEVNQLKTSMEYGSTKMTQEIDILRDMVSHLSHDIVGIRQIFAESFSHVDHHVNSAQSQILANVSAIDSKVRSHGGLLNSITDNIANIGSNLAGFSGRINDVWDLMRNMGVHMDQFDTRILKVADQMTGVHENVGQVNALISNVGYKVQDVGRQLSDMEHHMGAVGTQFIGFLGSVNDNFIKVNVHLENVHDRIISNVSRVRGDLDEMKEQLRDIRQVIADKCEGACPNGRPSNGAVPPHLIDAQVTVTTAKPGMQPPDFPSNGIAPTMPTNGYPSNGVGVQTDPGHRPNGHPTVYPPTYPSTTMSAYPYPPTSTSPYPPVHIPTSTYAPTSLPAYPSEHPSPAVSQLPNGYPSEHPSNGQPPVPPYLPTTTAPLTPGYPNGYPSEYPSNGQSPVPAYLPTTASPLPPGYPNGHPSEYPSNGQPPVPPYLPTTVTPFPAGYPHGYPSEHPSNGQPAVPPYLPTTVTPLPPGYPNGYPSTYPSNGQPLVPPYLPTTAYPLPAGYPNGHPSEHPSNGQPAVPPYLPTTVTPLPPGYPNGYPSTYPSNGQPLVPPYLPTTASPLPPGYPNGYPSEYPSNGQPPVTPYLPTTASPLPPGYPNGYPSEYPSNGQPPVPPYLPTTASPTPSPYPAQPAPSYPSDHPRPSIPQVHPPVYPRPTIPVIYPHLPETQIPVSPSHPDVPSGNDDSLPIGIPQGLNGGGLPIGCGEEFTGYCACLCPCDCTCPVINPTKTSIKRTKYERFPYMRKKCQCLCSCRCRQSAIFDSRPMTPALQPSPAETHVPMFQPPPIPNIPSTTHSPLIPNGQSPTPVVTSPKPPSTETANEFDRPGGISTPEEPPEETDEEEKPLDCCSQLREFFADEISWVLEAFGYELEQKMRRLREELYSFFDGVVRFHVDVSDLATDLKSQLSIAVANIVGMLNAVAARVYSLPIDDRPSDDPWFGSEAKENQHSSIIPPRRPTAHRPAMNPPEFTPPGQLPSYLPNMPNARPQGRPQLSNPLLPPNRQTSRPPLSPGQPTQRPNVNMHEARPSQQPPGRPLGGPPGMPLGGLPGRPLGGPPGRPLGGPPTRPRGPPPAQSQGGPPMRPHGEPSNRPQGALLTRPHGRPLPNPLGRPSGRPQYQGLSSPQSSDRPLRPPTEPAQNSPTQSRKLNNETITTSTEVSEYSNNARRYFPVDDKSEKGTTITNTLSSKNNKKNKRKKGCAIRRKKTGARSDSSRLTEIGDKELALANADGEVDYENYDGLEHDGDSYDVVPKGPIEVPGTELAIPDEDLDMVGTPIDQFTFHKMLQDHINEQMMKAVQPGSGYRPKGNRFPLTPWRGRSRNRYKLRPRQLFPMVPEIPFIPPPIGIPMPRIPIPNPLTIRPPPMPDVFGSLPPGAMVAGINGSPYSVSYNDGRGNSWNVNVNRRNYPVTAGTKADEWNASDEELEPQDEDVQQETEDELEEGSEPDNNSDEAEINETMEHVERNEEAR